MFAKSVVDWVAKNLPPEQVYDALKLKSWALDNGFVKAKETDSKVLKKLAKAINEVSQELFVQPRLIAVKIDATGISVRVDKLHEMVAPEQIDTKLRPSRTYPYIASTTIDGVRFFELLTEKRYGELERC